MLEYKEYIYAVYKERSFTKAAQVLHTSQPWLSAKVKEMEQKLGTPLFDRSTNPLTVTEAGEFYAAQAEKAMQIETEMAEYFERAKRESAGHLRIGSSMFFCTYVLPSLLSDFRRDHPGVTLTFEEGAAKDLWNKLLRGELDVVLEAEQPKAKQIHAGLWEKEEILLAVPARYPINEKLQDYCYSFEEILKRDAGVRKPAVPLLQFANQPFLLLDDTNDIHDRAVAICKNAGFVPSVKLQATIPEYVTPTDSVVFYQIDDPLANRGIYLSYVPQRENTLKKQLITYLEGEKI